MSGGSLPILMYHSIGPGPGPTSIDRATFCRQLDELLAAGYRGVSLDDALAWHRGQRELDGRCVALTFDDGFRDFATAAAPELAARGLPACVFLPTGKLGGVDDWETPPRGCEPRPLLTWSEVRSLARDGFDFGAHSVTHRDLTRLAPADARAEIAGSRRELEQQLGRAVRCFAPPLGRAGRDHLDLIRSHYELSVGTRLAPADRRSDLHDLPRIEMHYFRHPVRWRSWLAGRGGAYFALRRSLRLLRQLAVAR